ncbi:hypothetical protein [Francisella philomiragia]|uniref:Prophage minor tail Z family protein n=1 Tax=Francisella philomiragia TaxID=28110 RepID=A0ABS1GC50_9GAMM|nr:hypothetical protein [Francisella philomiragia]MBK2258721.1 hypothetical protein [Francisella philomiragia]MBK2302412.1 hypothetical protein [Francisella philomiragia]
MLQIDDKDIKKLENDLKLFAHKAFPFATKNTLNQSAFKAMNIAKQNVRNQMITRNKFTEQSIRVEQTKTLNTAKQAAYIGSIAEYMEDQEFGGTKTSKKGNHLSIATGYSSGEEGQQPRSRLPRAVNKMKNIKLRPTSRNGKTRKQRNIIAIRDAANNGQKYVYLDLGRRKGIFKVLGGKKRPKIKMVHDLSRKSVVIDKNPWLKPSVEETKLYIPEIYKNSLEFQVKRVGIFR